MTRPKSDIPSAQPQCYWSHRITLTQCGWDGHSVGVKKDRQGDWGLDTTYVYVSYKKDSIL